MDTKDTKDTEDIKYIKKEVLNRIKAVQEYKRIPDYDINRGNYGRISDDMIFHKLG